MYPTIHQVNPLNAPYPSPSGVGPPRSNGPQAAAASGGAPPTTTTIAAFPTLQVAIDPKFQVAPPVREPQPPPLSQSASHDGSLSIFSS